MQDATPRRALAYCKGAGRKDKKSLISVGSRTGDGNEFFAYISEQDSPRRQNILKAVAQTSEEGQKKCQSETKLRLACRHLWAQDLASARRKTAAAVNQRNESRVRCANFDAAVGTLSDAYPRSAGEATELRALGSPPAPRRITTTDRRC